MAATAAVGKVGRGAKHGDGVGARGRGEDVTRQRGIQNSTQRVQVPNI